MQWEKILAELIARGGSATRAELSDVPGTYAYRLSVYLWECKLKGGAKIARFGKTYKILNLEDFPGSGFADVVVEEPVVEVIAPEVLQLTYQPEVVVEEPKMSRKEKRRLAKQQKAEAEQQIAA